MSAGWGASGTLEADGARLEYACHGPAPAEAPTLVLLHEGLGCTALWRDFPARLAAATGFGVFVYSRAGYGQSDPVPLPRPLDYMTREALGLGAVLDGAGITRCLLIGHSDGATIAAEYAGRVVDPRLAGLVLIAPHFFTEPGGLAEIARAREMYETTDLPARLARYHRDPDNAFRGWNDAWLDPGFRYWNVAEVIDRFTVPCLALQGTRDQYGSARQVEIVAERSPARAEALLIEGAQHAPHLERPEETLTAVAGFCREVLA